MVTNSDMTILENLSIAKNEGQRFNLRRGLDKKDIEYLKAELKSLDMGLENRLDTKVSDLSGGQRQAISLLMAALSDIKILILDEHTAALDPKIADSIMKLTKK